MTARAEMLRRSAREIERRTADLLRRALVVLIRRRVPGLENRQTLSQKAAA